MQSKCSHLFQDAIITTRSSEPLACRYAEYIAAAGRLPRTRVAVRRLENVEAVASVLVRRWNLCLFEICKNEIIW